jgi:hypothetical protein
MSQCVFVWARESWSLVMRSLSGHWWISCGHKTGCNFSVNFSLINQDMKQTILFSELDSSLEAEVFLIVFRHTTDGRTPLDENSARGRDLFLSTYIQHSQEKTSVIRTRNSSKQSVVDPRVRLLGRRGRRISNRSSENWDTCKLLLEFFAVWA